MKLTAQLHVLQNLRMFGDMPPLLTRRQGVQRQLYFIMWKHHHWQRKVGIHTVLKLFHVCVLILYEYHSALQAVDSLSHRGVKIPVLSVNAD
jgi:hypothetical protein